MNYNPRYYNLDIIPGYRLAIIDVRLKRFINDYEIYSWPVDMVKLLDKIKRKGVINLTYKLIPGCSDRFDARADYDPNNELYIISINQKKLHRYPFKVSSDRRLNFTLAHEFGHIFLDHLCIPNELKTPMQINIEEEEANEFAGRLLMPEKPILTSNYTFLAKVAKQFNVSDQALWKRLNHLKRLDLLQSPVINVCETCCNSDISPVAEFCHICGDYLANNNKGVIRSLYDDGYPLSENGKTRICPVCENEEFSSYGIFCPICGHIVVNICTVCEGICAGNSRYCERCGAETTFYQENYLLSWEEAKAKLEEIPF